MNLSNSVSDDQYFKLGILAAGLFIFFFIWALLAIRRWNVQSAILKMGEDVADLKREVAQLKPAASEPESPSKSPSKTEPDFGV